MSRVRTTCLCGLLGLIVQAGCAGGWREIRTKRITGYAERPHAFREMMRHLELSYAALSSFFPKAPIGQVEVLFLDTAHLVEVFGAQRGGLVFAVVPGAPKRGQRNLLVMRDQLDNGLSTALLSHLFLHKAVPNAPLWLHEGMAHYLRTADIQEGNGQWRACFGLQVPLDVRLFQIPLDRFFTISWTQYAGEAGFYMGTARLLMDFIFHGDKGAHLGQLPSIFAGASRGMSGPQIMAELFPGVSLEQLGQRISDFKGSQTEQRERGILCPLPLPIARDRVPDESDPSESVVPPGEIEQLLAALQKLPHGNYFPSWYPPEVVGQAAGQ